MAYLIISKPLGLSMPAGERPVGVLSGSGRLTFRALQECCGSISLTVLNQRRKDLQAAQFVTRPAKTRCNAPVLVYVAGRIGFDVAGIAGAATPVVAFVAIEAFLFWATRPLQPADTA